jgi:hypothetical protein
MHTQTNLSHADALKIIDLIRDRLEAEDKGAAIAHGWLPAAQHQHCHQQGVYGCAGREAIPRGG